MTRVSYKDKKKSSMTSTAPGKLELVQPPQERKLDLACGQRCREGFEGIDLPGSRDHIQGEIDAVLALHPQGGRTSDEQRRLDELTKAYNAIKHEHNLLKFPWPFEDASITELHSSHFVEHIPTEFVDEEGTYVPCGTLGAKDLFFAFFDECYRIMTPGAWMTVIVPCGRSNRGFQDPTHRRFMMAETFLYLAADWRKMNKLDHYNVQCDFGVDIVPTCLSELTLRAPEVQQREFNQSWNAILDWVVRLQAKKPGMPAARPMPDLGLPPATQPR